MVSQQWYTQQLQQNLWVTRWNGGSGVGTSSGTPFQRPLEGGSSRCWKGVPADAGTHLVHENSRLKVDNGTPGSHTASTCAHMHDEAYHVHIGPKVHEKHLARKGGFIRGGGVQQSTCSRAAQRCTMHDLATNYIDKQ